MNERLDGIAERLRSVSEELAEIALDALGEAVRDGASKRPETERVVTRARVAVEKAVALLESLEGDSSDDGA